MNVTSLLAAAALKPVPVIASESSVDEAPGVTEAIDPAWRAARKMERTRAAAQASDVRRISVREGL
jgi:hypothetical protein